MSDTESKTATRVPARPPMGRGPWAGAGMPVEKSMNFGPSAKRLAKRLQPEWLPLVLVTVLAVISVTFTVIGPRILGDATNLIFEGAISANLPAGATQEQIVAGLRASGQDQQADMLANMSLNPGAGIDFAALSRVLLLVLAIYALAFLFGWIQALVLNGVVQRTMYRLRADVESKVNRLPLSYFDRMPRGELLSRVTN
ncbi:MAG: ABC transporter transmembrane domain-containing protein, partial [Mycetocola sp.]